MQSIAGVSYRGASEGDSWSKVEGSFGNTFPASVGNQSCCVCTVSVCQADNCLKASNVPRCGNQRCKQHRLSSCSKPSARPAPWCENRSDICDCTKGATPTCNGEGDKHYIKNRGNSERVSRTSLSACMQFPVQSMFVRCDRATLDSWDQRRGALP